MTHLASQPFSSRAAAVFLAGFTFLGLALSGLAIMLAPSGRIAQEIGWRLAFLSRAQWESLHLTLGVFFLFAAGWHIWLHWPVITNLLWQASTRTLSHRREVGLALLAVLLLVTLALLDLPPASWLVDLSDIFKRGIWR